MALKTKTVTITAEGRDKGKVFLLTEMPAVRAEAFAARVLGAMSRAGVELPDDVAQSGAVGLIAAGTRAFAAIAWTDAEPLLAEMLACVQIVPDLTKPVVTRSLVESDTEEVATLLLLRGELVELHTGFSIAATLSTLGQAAKARSSATETSPSSSEPSSEAA